MASYKALWSEPTRVMYGDYEVTSLGLPSLGGLQTLSSLMLADSKRGDYRKSADVLYALIQIGKLERALSYAPPDQLKRLFPGLDASPSARLSPATTKQLASVLRDRNWEAKLLRATQEPARNHSSSVVAVDEQGNVAALLHSCNCLLWGTTGIFVDGISIPDAATFQQAGISRAGPGTRLPEATNPVIVLKDKRPVLASVAIGSALHEVTLQNLINVLHLGLDPQTSVRQPNFQGPFLGMRMTGQSQPQMTKEVLDPGFSDSVIQGLKRRGLDIYEGRDGAVQSGYWIGIRIDPKNKSLSGGATRRLNSFIDGY
jgi:gamma-glutamyltranspeptidase / glutathione hydrolase